MYFKGKDFEGANGVEKEEKVFATAHFQLQLTLKFRTGKDLYIEIMQMTSTWRSKINAYYAFILLLQVLVICLIVSFDDVGLT